MELKINGEVITVNDVAAMRQFTLLQLVHHLSLENRSGIAIAVNDAVIPRCDWSDTQLQQNDAVLIISASQGG